MTQRTIILLLLLWAGVWNIYWVTRAVTAGDELERQAGPYLSNEGRDLSVERDSIVRHWTWAYQIPAEIAIAVSHAENWGGDSTAVSYAGAVGLMQVLPRAHGWLIKQICGYDVSIFERECNVRVGLHILSLYYRRWGHWPTALKAYNGSLRHGAQGRAYVKAVDAHMHAGGTLQ